MAVLEGTLPSSCWLFKIEATVTVMAVKNEKGQSFSQTYHCSAERTVFRLSSETSFKSAASVTS